jgi:hypothetical protein
MLVWVKCISNIVSAWLQTPLVHSSLSNFFGGTHPTYFNIKFREKRAKKARPERLPAAIAFLILTKIIDKKQCNRQGPAFQASRVQMRLFPPIWSAHQTPARVSLCSEHKKEQKQTARLQMTSRRALPSGACVTTSSGMCATDNGVAQDAAQDVLHADDGGVKPECINPGSVEEDKENQRPPLETDMAPSAHPASNSEPENCPQMDAGRTGAACPQRAHHDGGTAREPEMPPPPGSPPVTGRWAAADMDGAACRHLTEASPVSTALPRSPLLDITRVRAIH